MSLMHNVNRFFSIMQTIKSIAFMKNTITSLKERRKKTICACSMPPWLGWIFFPHAWRRGPQDQEKEKEKKISDQDLQVHASIQGLGLIHHSWRICIENNKKLKIYKILLAFCPWSKRNTNTWRNFVAFLLLLPFRLKIMQKKLLCGPSNLSFNANVPSFVPLDPSLAHKHPYLQLTLGLGHCFAPYSRLFDHQNSAINVLILLHLRREFLSQLSWEAMGIFIPKIFHF